MSAETVLSGMRPTGMLHLGHLHGVLRNWVDFQDAHRCYYMVADWHALTTDYAERRGDMGAAAEEMVLCWLAAGVDPDKATLFVQSWVPEHAELHLILSMLCPLSWLERMPSFKDQQQQLADRDLSTYGFLGYPLLQSADILAYRAGLVPVGEDQVPHIEFAREVARRFNHLYGADPGSGGKLLEAKRKLGPQRGAEVDEAARRYRTEGGENLLGRALGLAQACAELDREERAALEASIRGTRTQVLPEPRAQLTSAPRMAGLDGRKMSKSYGNTVGLLEDGKEVERKVMAMPTDPARVRRADPGDPDKCPVWQLHQAYSPAEERERVRSGCTTAGIGCVDCKRIVLAGMEAELEPLRARAAQIGADRGTVRDMLVAGTERAREAAGETLAVVRRAAGLAQ